MNILCYLCTISIIVIVFVILLDNFKLFQAAVNHLPSMAILRYSFERGMIGDVPPH